MTIQQYLDKHHMSRRQFLALLLSKGWRVSDAAICRWIKGQRKPSQSAQVLLRLATEGEIDG